MSKPFRFGAQLSSAPSRAAWASLAQRAESLGYSTLSIPDHFGDQLAPAPALMAAADATTALRIGALVWDNDYRHPVVLAKEAATLDLLSDGRLELGVGAGWMRTDYDAAGMPYDRPGVRLDRFEEGLAILKGLLSPDGGPVSYSGSHYTVTALEGLPKPVQRPWPPILVGGGGRRVLSIAAREADIVGINVDLRAGAVGPDAGPNTTPEATAEKIGWVRTAAGSRFDDLELNVLTFFTSITGDRTSMAEGLAGAFGVSPAQVLASPHVLLGTVQELCDDLLRQREELGISYVTVQSEEAMDALAPVVAQLAGT